MRIALIPVPTNMKFIAILSTQLQCGSGDKAHLDGVQEKMEKTIRVVNISTSFQGLCY